MTLTVTNVTDGANEILTSTARVALTNGNNVVTANNNLTVTVSLVGDDGDGELLGRGAERGAAADPGRWPDLRNTSQNPTDADRVVTITELVDSGSNAGPNDNTAALNLVSTVNVDAGQRRRRPHRRLPGDTSTFTEDGAAADIFSSVTASTIEAGQTSPR